MKYECHAHTKIYHPKYFLGKITPLIDKNNKGIVKTLHKIIPFCEKDAFDRYATFLEYSEMSEEEVLKRLIKQNPDTYICVKIMDLSCMGAGEVEKGILEQFGELLLLKKKYPQLILFPVIDPRNEDLETIYMVMKNHIDKIGGFGFYPNIGYTIMDERLDKFFSLLNIYKKACIIHTTDTTPVYYRGSDLEKLLDPLRKYFFFNKTSNKKLACGNFCHPHFVTERAKQYQNINFSIAHFGGVNKSMRFYTLKAIEQYENIYADVSYTFENDVEDLKQYLTIPKINRKILPGRDFYMNTLIKSNGQLARINNNLQENAKKWLRIDK